MTEKQFEKLIETLKEIEKGLASHSDLCNVLTELNSLANLIEQQTKVIEKILDKDKPYLAYDQRD